MNDPEIRAWADAQKKTLGALADSAVFAGIVSQKYLDDPMCMLQIGAAICLGKPICLIVFDNVQLPPKLRAVADRVIRVRRGDDEQMQRAGDELKTFCESHGGGLDKSKKEM